MSRLRGGDVAVQLGARKINVTAARHEMAFISLCIGDLVFDLVLIIASERQAKLRYTSILTAWRGIGGIS